MDRKIIEFLILKKSFNQIAKELHVSKKRIRSLFEMANKEGFLSMEKELPPFPSPLFPDEVPQNNIICSEPDEQLIPYKNWIKDRREAGWHLVSIYEELPISVGRSSFYRFIERHNLNQGDKDRLRLKVTSEIIHSPGESLLLDWGKVCDILDPISRKKKTLWAFVGILGYSRFLVVRLVWSNSTEETLASLESMLHEIQGVPKKLTSDNPKCFSITASKYEPLLNPAFESFSRHYGTIPEILPPREPKKKGKVERVMPYIRRLLETHLDKWSDLETAQSFLNKKLQIANERLHGTTKLRPIEVYINNELPALKKLPALAYRKEEYHETAVRKDGHVYFRGKYYSVDSSLIGKEIFIIGTSEIVSIFLNGKLIETHSRITNPHVSKSTKDLHLPYNERHIKDNEHYFKLASNIGPNVKTWVEEVIKQGNGFVDTRKVWGVLSLDKKYSNEKIDNACRLSLEWKELSFQKIKKLLEIELLNIEEKGGVVEIETKGKNKFIRPQSEYSKLLIN